MTEQETETLICIAIIFAVVVFILEAFGPSKYED